MKALTLTQPYATLVAIGAKRIETRSWATSYRGPLAIHAGAGLGPVGERRAFARLCRTRPFEQALGAADLPNYDLYPEGMPFGAVVALVRLVGICRITNAGIEGFQPQPAANEIAFGDYTPGRYAWLLADVRPLAEPIPAKGALGLWEWEPQERAAAPSE